MGYALVLASTIFQYTSLDSIAFEIEEIVDITAAATILVVGFYKGYKSYVYNKATKEALDDPLKRSVLSETEYEERLKSILWLSTLYYIYQNWRVKISENLWVLYWIIGGKLVLPSFLLRICFYKVSLSFNCCYFLRSLSSFRSYWSCWMLALILNCYYFKDLSRSCFYFRWWVSACLWIYLLSYFDSYLRAVC